MTSGAGSSALVVVLLVCWSAGAAGLADSPSKKQLIAGIEDGPDAWNHFQALDFDSEERLNEDYHQTMKSFVQRFERQQLELARQNGSMEAVENPSLLLEKLIGNLEVNSCGINESSSPVRENLVVLPAGDSFDASKWMNDPKRSNWDIILIYYGKDRFFRCPLCKAVFRASGAKWRLAWGFTLLPEWQEYRKQYRAIMFADDDLGLDMCALNTVFSVMKAYKLLAAQPSLCDVDGSFTPWTALYQNPENILRYTTMNEIMAPAFEMDYFQNFIRPSLHNAYVGWGLDFVWPFLLKYPRDKLAVVDQVCMFHPPSQPNKPNSVYSAASPFKKKEEETRRFAQFGYFPSEVEKLGFQFMPVVIVGSVPKPWYMEASKGASGRGPFSSPEALSAPASACSAPTGGTMLVPLLLLVIVQSVFIAILLHRGSTLSRWVALAGEGLAVASERYGLGAKLGGGAHGSPSAGGFGGVSSRRLLPKLSEGLIAAKH